MNPKTIPALAGALRAGNAGALAAKLCAAGRETEVVYCVAEFLVCTGIAKRCITSPVGERTEELLQRAKGEIEAFVPLFIPTVPWASRLMSRHELKDAAFQYWTTVFEDRRYFPLLTPDEEQVSDLISMAAQLGREELQRLGIWGPEIRFSEDNAEGILSSIAKRMLRAFLDPNGSFRELSDKDVVVSVDSRSLASNDDGNEQVLLEP